MRFGVLELVVILALILLVGGYKALPKIADAVKKSKKIITDDTKESVQGAEDGADV